MQLPKPAEALKPAQQKMDPIELLKTLDINLDLSAIQVRCAALPWATLRCAVLCCAVCFADKPQTSIFTCQPCSVRHAF